MFNRIELKELAKTQLKGRWGSVVLVTFLYVLITGVLGTITNKQPGIGFVINVLVSAPIAIGIYMYYLRFVKTNEKIDIKVMFEGFNHYLKALGISLWTSLWVCLWSLLFVIPGIVKGIAYSQAMYIIADNPDIGVKDALKISMQMTKGYKGKIFVTSLSFIGWGLLGCLTLGIGFLWLIPYMYTTFTNMYYKLKELSLQSGICTQSDFTGES